MKKSPTIILLVTVSIITIAIYAACYFLFNQIRVKNESISQTINEIDIESGKFEQLHSLRGLLNDTEEARSQLSTFIITDEDVADFASSVESLGKITRATTTISSLNKSSSGDKVYNTEFLSVAISMDGNWQSLFRTVSLIENMPHAMTIDSVSLSRDQTPLSAAAIRAGKVPRWIGSLTFRILKYK